MGNKRLTLAAALAVCAALVAGSLIAQAQTVSGVSVNANSLQVVKPPRAVDTVPSRTDRHVATNINNYPDYAEGVQFQDADPSPRNSGIENYTFQEQRLEIKPTDGTIRVIRSDQKNLIQEYVQKVIPVKNVDTIEILPAIKTVCQKEGGDAETIRDYTKHKYAIQVVVPARMLPALEKAIAALDVEWASSFNDGSADLYYKAKYRDVELVDRIAAAFGTGFERTVGYSTIDGTNNAVLRQDEQYWIDRYLTGAKLADIPEHMINLEGAIYELNMNNDLKLGLDYIAWKNGPGRNLFDFLLAGQHNHEDFKNASSVYNPGLTNVGLFTGRDIPIEVVADAILDDLGIGGDPFSDNRRHYEQEGNQEYYAANFLMTAAYFDFLQSKGKAKVLGRPSITTRSGSVGTWSSVDQILAFEAGEIIDPNQPMVDSNITTNPGFEGTTPDLIRDQMGNFIFGDIGEIIPSIQNGDPIKLYDSRHWGDLALWNGYGDTNVSPRVLRYKNSGQTGVFLSILPMIGTETTELTVDYASSDLNGYTPQGTPIVNTRTYATTVRVADGQPFVVGGLARTEKAKTKQGAPWLSALPVLGYLFGQEANVDRQDTIVMVLTPNIYTGAQSDMEMPAEAKTIIAQAKGEAEVALPKNPFGFDQWLLDKEKN
ncbi:MAG: hypothetical protein NTW86_20110 [Candidatus Sumerlaeota bacterium]|nr:hypothetical protein [Candidatus Sumerlaeota bacterium]